MIKYILICILLVACGKKEEPSIEINDCTKDPKLTNDQIIADTEKCRSAGLDAQALHCGDDMKITVIQCLPKPGEKE